MFRSHSSSERQRYLFTVFYEKYVVLKCFSMFLLLAFRSFRRPEGCSNDLFTGHAEKTAVDMGQQKFSLFYKRKREMTFEVS